VTGEKLRARGGDSARVPTLRKLRDRFSPPPLPLPPHQDPLKCLPGSSPIIRASPRNPGDPRDHVQSRCNQWLYVSRDKTGKQHGVPRKLASEGKKEEKGRSGGGRKRERSDAGARSEPPREHVRLYVEWSGHSTRRDALSRRVYRARRQSR